MIASLGFKAKVRAHIYKKARYSIKNVSKKDHSKIIKEFEKLPYDVYEKKRPKHEPTDSFLYLVRELAKCMMRADAFNSRVYPVRTKMTAPSSHVCSTDEYESKHIIVHETLSKSCYTDKDESKRSIVNETCSVDKEKLISTEEYKLECIITEQKDAKSEVTYDVPKYFNVFNVFEYGRNIL